MKKEKNMSNNSKINFMKTSELYLKITERQRNAFDNKELLSLIISEKRASETVPLEKYHNRMQ
jgi:hypothetical protein